MEMFGKIRRMHLRDKLSLHEISKRTGLSRNTLRKWLRMPGDAAAPAYVRGEAPGKLTEFHDALVLALNADAHRIKQNRRTAKALFIQIKADGYAGGYSRVTDFIRDWRGREGKNPHAFVPLKFDLGEAFQFDWSEEGLVIGGIYRRIQVSHLKLCASRAFWLVAYPSQGHEMLFDAHTRSFAGFCRISEHRRGNRVNCGARTRTTRHAQLQRDALSDRCDPGLHPLVCGLPAELPAPRGDDGRARRVGRPFVDQPLGDSFPAAHREDGPETQAPGRRQLAYG